MNRIVLAGLGLTGVAVALTACEPQMKVPREDGVCYLLGFPVSGEVKFNAIARDVPSLEHCAVHIYNARTGRLATGTAGEVTAGSYGGGFLWATNREVKYSLKYEGMRMPFLVRAPDNRLVPPGSIVYEDDLPKGPITVELPDNLPTK